MNAGIVIAFSKVMMDMELSDKTKKLRLDSLMALDAYISRLQQHFTDDDEGLIYTICEKKAEFILGATSHAQIEEILKPHAINLHTGKPTSRYHIEEEELLGLTIFLTSLRTLSNQGERRFYQLLWQLTPKKAEAILRIIATKVSPEYAKQLRRKMEVIKP